MKKLKIFILQFIRFVITGFFVIGIPALFLNNAEDCLKNKTYIFTGIWVVYAIQIIIFSNKVFNFYFAKWRIIKK